MQLFKKNKNWDLQMLHFRDSIRDKCERYLLIFLSFFSNYPYSVEEDKSYNGLLDTLKTRVTLSSDGKVEWFSPIMFRISCAIDVARFPFDTQKCEFRFGSFTYDSARLELSPESDTADLSKLTGL